MTKQAVVALMMTGTYICMFLMSIVEVEWMRRVIGVCIGLQVTELGILIAIPE